MLVPVQTSGDKPPLFLVHGLREIMPLARAFATVLGADQPFYVLNAAAVEGGSRVLAKQGERLLVAPGGPVDAGRHERVVHVADGEDARVEKELLGLQPTWVAGSVQTLVVVAYELPHRIREATEVVQQAASPVGVPFDHRIFPVVEGARLLQDRVRDRELPDVVNEPPDRKRPQPAGREAEGFADLNCQERDATCVLRRVLVLLGEAHGQRPYMGTEEGLLGDDQLGGAEIARQRSRLRGTPQIEGNGDADEENAVELELVAHPPAEIAIVHCQGRYERGSQPGDPDHDDQVEATASEKERPQGTHREQAVDRKAGREHRQRDIAQRRGHRRHQAREHDP